MITGIFRTRHRRAALPALAITFLAGCCLSLGCTKKPPRSTRSPSTKSESKKTRSPTPIRETRFRNANSQVAFIGSQACAECHRDAHQSYLETPHSRALGPLQDEPEPGGFDHALSARSYAVSETGDEMRHSETLLSEGDEDVAIGGEYPVKYAIGSGNHSRSYLCELDGFLIESPITWYASPQAWKISPGYDALRHGGFHRMVDRGCIQCHAGRIDPMSDKFHPKILEQSIGCESCHGPGALHAKYHEENEHPTGEPDMTIVHLGRLTRVEAESICATCHMRGDATVLLQDRKLTDFRPGMMIEDVRADFARPTNDGKMKVVGHVEQMRRSRCYIESDSLTCTSCHDPHFRPAPKDRIAYFRDKCLACHDSTADCGLPEQQRLAKSSADNCVQCHMPKGDTEIPHFAFTHHRVGLHETKDAGLEAEVHVHAPGELVPIHPIDHLTPIEHKRARGLGHIELIGKAANAVEEQWHIDAATRLLTEVADAGVQDPVVDGALARLDWLNDNLLEAMTLARQALTAAPDDPDSTYVLADSLFQRGEWRQSLRTFQRLTELRRVADDWANMGECQLRLGQTSEALTSLKKAVAISPFRPDLRQRLADAAREVGDAPTATRVERETAILERALRKASTTPAR